MDNKTVAKAKLVANFVASQSVGYCISSAIVNNVAADTKSRKLKVKVGSFVIAGMVKQHTEPIVDKTVDSVVKAIDTVQTAWNKTKTEKTDDSL